MTDLRAFWRKHQYKIVLLLFIACFLLGLVSLLVWGVGLIDALFYTLQMIVLNFDRPATDRFPDTPSDFWVYAFDFARFGLPAVVSYVAILGYMRIADRTLDRFRARRSQENIVVIGNSDQARVVAEAHLAASGKGVTVLALDPHASELDKLRQAGALIVRADATDEHELKKVGVDHATIIYILAGSDQEHLQILTALRDLKCRDHGAPVRPTICLVHIYDDFLAARVTEWSINDGKSAIFNVRAFNAWKESARQIVTRAGPHIPSPVIDHTSATPHLLMIGFSSFGQQVIEQLARLGHYGYGKSVKVTLVAPPESHALNRIVARFPALDPKLRRELWGRNGKHWGEEAKNLLPLIDLRVLDHPTDGITVSALASDLAPISMAYICTEDAESALVAAHSLILQTPQQRFPVILTAVRDLENLGKFVDADCDLTQAGSISRSGAARVRTFNALREGLRLHPGEHFVGQYAEREAALVKFYFQHRLRLGKEISQVAQPVCRLAFAIQDVMFKRLAETLRESENNKEKNDAARASIDALARQFHTELTAIRHQLDEKRMQTIQKMEKAIDQAGTLVASAEKWKVVEAEWQAALEWERESSRDVVRHLSVKQLSSAHLFAGEPSAKEREQLSRMEHTRWVAERLLTGWRYAEVSDRGRFLHADIKPYDALTTESKAKDDTIIDVSRLLLTARLSTVESVRKADDMSRHAMTEDALPAT